MAAPEPQRVGTPPATSSEPGFTLRAVSIIMTAVVSLIFLFGFGNVWALARHLGVTPWVAPLVAPAVDLSVIGLLLGTWYLALHGARSELLRPTRRLLVLSSLITLALNITEPLLTGHTGKAAFDAVGPLLLIGWAEVGPGLLQAIANTTDKEQNLPDPSAATTNGPAITPQTMDGTGSEARISPDSIGHYTRHHAPRTERDDLLERARQEDALHWTEHHRPISAETLRKRLSVGSARSRMLVTILRGDTDRNHAIRQG
ncbi:SpdA protein [Streptomyces sp. NPDC002680]|uniref:SpdA protein n=1 Tax=Streptomyces sp. NPDC002680 TaxID=3364659 RepID=UPI00368B7FB1